MGRRSQHKPEELRELILEAAQSIVESGGIAQLSAREVARAIGYAPGTLYNMYENLDEILLRVQVRLLDDLDKALAEEVAELAGADAVRRFATRYIEFAYERPRLWGLLHDHRLASAGPAPAWFLEKFNAPMLHLESALGDILGTDDKKELSLAARAIWSSVHGITQISTTNKLGHVTMEAALALVETIVNGYLSGLNSVRLKRSSSKRQTPERSAPAA